MPVTRGTDDLLVALEQATERAIKDAGDDKRKRRYKRAHAEAAALKRCAEAVAGLSKLDVRTRGIPVTLSNFQANHLHWLVFNSRRTEG